MRNPRKRLMECLKALRSQMQVDLILTKIIRTLSREIENDAICGT